MDCKHIRLLCPWGSPGKSTAVGCHFLLQGIFLTQVSNPHLLHYRQILYQRSHQEANINLLKFLFETLTLREITVPHRINFGNAVQKLQQMTLKSRLQRDAHDG